MFDVERVELARKLKSLGADLDTTISKRTNFVLIGREAGPSKLAKMQSLIENGYDIRPLGQKEVTLIMSDNFNII